MLSGTQVTKLGAWDNLQIHSFGPYQLQLSYRHRVKSNSGFVPIMHCSAGNCLESSDSTLWWAQQHFWMQACLQMCNHKDLPTSHLSFQAFVPQLRKIHSVLLALKCPNGYGALCRLWSIHDNTQLRVTYENTLDFI